MSSQPPAPTERSRVRRLPERGAYDRQQIYDILDEGLVCHVGFVHEGHPVVIPTGYGRLDDSLVLHGSVLSRMMREMAKGVEICVTVTLVDGLVLARSQFHHSMNYRSVVVFGRAVPVEDDAEKHRALDALVEHLVPGRDADSRPANRKELNGTEVLLLPLDEASAKIRQGPPGDAKADLELEYWSGVIPLTLTAGQPETAPDQPADAQVPGYAASYARPGRSA